MKPILQKLRALAGVTADTAKPKIPARHDVDVVNDVLPGCSLATRHIRGHKLNSAIDTMRVADQDFGLKLWRNFPTIHTAFPNLPTPSSIFPTSAVAKLNRSVDRSGLDA